MEKTLAREIYKRMEIGRRYTTNELRKIVGDTLYYAHQPDFKGWEYYNSWETEEEHDRKEKEWEEIFRRGIKNELWQIVKAGYARTEVFEEEYKIVKGLKYGVKNRDWSKVPSRQYTIRYWWRIK